MAVVAVLQSHSAKSPPQAHLLHCISLYSAYYGFHITAEHVPGVLNEVADALSRDRAAYIAPFLSQVPRFHVSEGLHRLIISERPDWGSQTWTDLFTVSLTRVSLHPPRESTARANAAS